MASDVIIRNLSCCYKSKRSKQLDKIANLGKKEINNIFDIRTRILGLKEGDILGVIDIGDSSCKYGIGLKENESFSFTD